MVDGADLWRDHQLNLPELRRKIGYVFQFPETQFFADTVFEELAFGPRNLGLSEQDMAERIEACLHSVGLPSSEVLDKNPLELSAGEQRLVAIAGTLAMRPEWLIFDEPTAGLDRRGEEAVTDLVNNLMVSGKTVILISHDLDLVFALSRRVILLHQGQIVFDGPGADLTRDEKRLRRWGYVTPGSVRISRYLYVRGLVESPDLVSLQDIKKALQARFK